MTPLLKIDECCTYCCTIPGATGVLRFRDVISYVSNRVAGQTVLANWDEQGSSFSDLHAVVLSDYAWPPKGTRYVDNTAPRPDNRPNDQPPQNQEVLPMS